MTEKLRPGMTGDVLRSWAEDAQKELEALRKARLYTECDAGHMLPDGWSEPCPYCELVEAWDAQTGKPYTSVRFLRAMFKVKAMTKTGGEVRWIVS